MPAKGWIIPPEERFWAMVEKTETCWFWRGNICKGYGLFTKDELGNKIRSHKFSYELAKGPVPKGLQIDHLCRNTICVNPEHMEAVTGRENKHRSPITVNSINSAKIVCIRGHPLFWNKDHTRRNCQFCKKLIRQANQILAEASAA